MSYLQPMIISFFLLIAFNIKQLYIYLIIFLNFFSWFIEIEPLKIKYLNEDKCNNVQAISAEFDLTLKKGRYFYYLDTRDKIKCWVDVNTIRGKKILEGKALK